jgi:lipopolysaccharide assembly outer membrane protein LptD (OstA)
MIRLLALLVGTLALVALAKPSPTTSQQPSVSPTPPSVSPSAQPSASPSLPPGSPRSPNASHSPGSAPAAFDLGVWTVHASSLDANFKTGDFSTPAKVVMTRVGGDVSADRANGNYKKQVLYLNGHVVMHDSQGGAGSLTESGGGAHPSSPSTLTADKAQVDGTAKVYRAIGNVHYVQADTNVTADNGTLDDQAHTLLLQGAVHIVAGTRKMNAGKVLYNTQTGDAHAEKDVTMQFPGAFHRKLATPKPLKVPAPPP